jgi:hypothetical protein
MKKRILINFAGILAILTGMFACEHGSDNSGSTVYMNYDVKTSAELDDVLFQIKNNAAPSGGEYTINITENFAAVSKIISGGEYNGKNIILKGNTADLAITFNKTTGNALFEISNGTLTLENITLTGVDGTKNNYKALVIVSDSAAMVIKEGAKITGNINLTTGDPDVPGFTGGGGIQIVRGGKVVMEGGEISGNSATQGSGVGIWNGTFIMKDGLIQGNGLHHYDNNITSRGGGVHLNLEGDVFTMEGGKITGNKATRGGGVSVCCGTFTMRGSDSLISENIAGATAGGVGICCSTFIMEGGIISKNKAGNKSAQPQKYGGGVGRWGSGTFNAGARILWDAPVKFEKTGGTIYGSNGGENANIVENDGARNPMTPTDTNTANFVKGDAVYMLRERNGSDSPIVNDTVTEDYYYFDDEEYEAFMPQ